MVEAARRGAGAVIIADRRMTLSEQTAEMQVCLLQASRGGVLVRLGSGEASSAEYEAVGRNVKGLRGIQHSKGLLVQSPGEVFCLIGSGNWTTSTRANSEMGVVLRRSGDTEEVLLKWFALPILRSEPMEGVLEADRLKKASGNATRRTRSNRR
jgi:phosphatidylserine/phosphatidylglycerophosphate/cardiolipin synthase-like enzyme